MYQKGRPTIKSRTGATVDEVKAAVLLWSRCVVDSAPDNSAPGQVFEVGVLKGKCCVSKLKALSDGGGCEYHRRGRAPETNGSLRTKSRGTGCKLEVFAAL